MWSPSIHVVTGFVLIEALPFHFSFFIAVTRDKLPLGKAFLEPIHSGEIYSILAVSIGLTLSHFLYSFSRLPSMEFAKRRVEIFVLYTVTLALFLIDVYIDIKARLQGGPQNARAAIVMTMVTVGLALLIHSRLPLTRKPRKKPRVRSGAKVVRAGKT
jgi:hypothetical protein